MKIFTLLKKLLQATRPVLYLIRGSFRNTNSVTPGKYYDLTLCIFFLEKTVQIISSHLNSLHATEIASGADNGFRYRILFS